MSVRKALSLVLALLMLTASALAWGEKSNTDAYNDAIKLLQENKFSEAADAFAAIGNYEDASRLAMYCRALAAGEAGSYALSVTAFQSLGDFRDSQLLAVYYAGRSYEDALEYEKAQELLSGIALFKDVATRLATFPEKIKARDYAIADDAEQKGSLETALAGFKALGTYSDSAARASAVQVKINERDAANAEATRAATYNAAEQAEKAGDYIAAYDGFVSLGNYLDSADRAAALRLQASYAKGLEAIHNGQYNEAYIIFAELGDYEDSQEKAYALGVSNFSKLKNVADGVATFTFHDNIGLINFNENIMIAPQWSSLSTFTEGLASATKGEKVGVIDLKGNVVSDYQWYQVSPFADGLCIVCRETVSGWKATYTYALMTSEGKVLGLSDDWRKMNGESSGHRISDPPRFKNDRMVVCAANEMYGFINSAGEKVIAPTYQYVYPFANGAAAAKKSDLWGFIDPDGNTLIPFMYSEVTSFNADGYADVCLNGEWQIIDMSGNLIYFKGNASNTAGAQGGDDSTEVAQGKEIVASAECEAFVGPVKVTVTMKENGMIVAIEVDASEEIIGRVCSEPEFTNQFIGKVGPFSLGKDIDGVSGATFTSQAVVDAVNSLYSK